MPLLTDENGIVKEGRFAGRHIDEVEKYLEGLEAAVVNPNADDKPPASDDKPKEPTEAEKAAAKLAASTANRLDPIQAQILATQEMNDEEEFAKSVTDYEKYRERIREIKHGNAAKNLPGLHPAQRAQKGIHRTLYINVKSTDPKVLSRLYKPVEDDEPPADKAGDPPPPPVAARGPKPAPPLAAPTPGSRQAPPPAGGKEREPKLVATRKLESFCKANGLDVKAYLMRLEDSGKTQDDIDNMGQMGRSTDSGRRDPYARTFAKRS